MSQRIRLVVTLVLLLGLLVSLILVGIHYAIQKVPGFYERAAAVSINVQKEASDEMERRALDLHNRARRSGRWTITFEERQINGWLAAGLPENFPDLLPPEVDAPRLAIEAQQIALAFRYQGPQISTVVTLKLKISLTDQENTVAVQILSAHAGLVPLPLKDFLEQISFAARQADINLRWVQKSDDPVALITIPAEFRAFKKKHVRIDTLELRPGEVYLAGTTQKLDE